jgi:tetratricopeptide (TPR) repeat protein
LLLLTLAGCSTTGELQVAESHPQYQQAESLMANGEYAEAIPLLREIVAVNPDMANASVNLAIAYRKNDQPEKAFETIMAVVEKHPDHAVALNQLGIIQRQRGNFAAALAAYDRATTLDIDYALAHRNLGILYDIYLQIPDRALAHYEKYLVLSDGDDKEVSNWIIDLERRIAAAQKRNNQ